MLNKNNFLSNFSNVRDGMHVHSQDGEKLGKIIAMDDDSFTVEKGFFFPKDFTARYDDIVSVDNDQVILNRQTADLSDWKDESYSGWGEVDTHNTNDTPYQTAGVFGIGATGNMRDSSDTLNDNRGWDRRTDTRSHDLNKSLNDKDLRVTLSEEELEARKTMQQTGEVRLRKIVHTEHKQITVPVMKEEVTVERTPVSELRSGNLKSSDFKEETLSMPVMEENVELIKHAKVKEEVRLHKDTRIEQQTLSGDVRSEDVEIDQPKRKIG